MATPQPGKSRTLWRRLAWVSIAVLLLGVSAALALRAYASDARLQAMLQSTLQTRLGCEVAVDGLHISWLHGVDIYGVSIGPLPGFEHRIAYIAQAHARWSLAHLWARQLTVEDISAQDIELIAEQNAQGLNLTVMAERLSPPSETHAPTEPMPLTQPNLPLQIDVNHLAMTLRSVSFIAPDQWLRLQNVSLVGRFSGAGTQMDLSATLALGAAAGADALLTVRQGATHATVKPRGSLSVASHGLHDTQLKLAWGAHVVLEPMPPLDVTAEVGLAVDLLAGTLKLNPCSAQLGEHSHMQGSAAISHLLASPQVALDNLTGQLDLNELAPWIAAAVPQTRVQGHVTFASAPVQGDITTLRNWEQLPTQVTLQVHNLTLAQPAASVTGLDANALIKTFAGEVQVDSTLHLQRADAAPIHVGSTQIHAQIHSAITPWYRDEATGMLAVHVDATVADVAHPQGALSRLSATLDVNAPIAWCRGRADGGALQLDLRSRVGRFASRGATQTQAQLQNIIVAVTADVSDRRGDVLQTQGHLSVADMHLQAAGRDASWPNLACSWDVAREGARLRIGQFDCSVLPTPVRLHVQGGIDATHVQVPVFDNLQMTLAPTALTTLLRVLPPGVRPTATFDGTVQARAALHGRVDWAQWAARLQPPALPTDFNDALAWSQASTRYAAWFQSLTQSLTQNVPFTIALALDANHIAVDDGHNHAEGMTVHADAGVQGPGPQAHVSIEVADVLAPVTMHQITADWHLSLDANGMRVAGDNAVATLTLADEPTPIEGVSLVLRGSYHLGGDLRLDTVSLSAKNRGVALSAAGVLTQPLRLLASHAWLLPGMPGVASQLQWQLSLHNDHPLALTQAGLRVDGNLDVAGKLSLADGWLTFAGDLAMENFSAQVADGRIERVNGRVPCDVRLYFGKALDTTVVARGLPVGGGTVSIRTVSEDIRDRPARPVYYDRMRPYRPGVGITASKLAYGPYEVYDFALEGRVQDGMVLADWIAMNILGGDVVGNMAYQLGRDSTVRGALSFKASNMDASYFPALSLQAGPESEFSADMNLAFMFGDAKRDVALTTNVTKIGVKALDRLLQLLDPQGKDEKLQQARSNLSWIRIREVSMWVRYENLNMDLTYDPLLRLPGTQIGYRPIPREVLRRYNVGDSLDLYLQPVVNKVLGQPLGWTHAP